MASNWRLNVARFGLSGMGPTMGPFLLPVKLVAELLVPIQVGSVVCTHIVQTNVNGFLQTWLAALPAGSNVLAMLNLFWFPPPFPSGFAVVPDN